MSKDTTPTTRAPSPARAAVRFSVNGERSTLSIEPRVTLLDALREQPGLTGTKKGCDRAHAAPARSWWTASGSTACLTLAVQCAGTRDHHHRGPGRGRRAAPGAGGLHQQDAFQCGYCTPGQIMSAVACIHEGHAGSDDEIREWMSGNICRCGAYPQHRRRRAATPPAGKG